MSAIKEEYSGYRINTKDLDGKAGSVGEGGVGKTDGEERERKKTGEVTIDDGELDGWKAGASPAVR